MRGPTRSHKGVGDKKKQLDESILYSLDRPVGVSRAAVVFSGSRANSARRATREPGDAAPRKKKEQHPLRKKAKAKKRGK